MQSKKTYQTIFFDLDHTLWDFEKNASETLSHLFEYFDLSKSGLFTLEQFLSTFHVVNRKLWRSFDQGEIDKAYIRQERFRIVCEYLKVSPELIPMKVGELYLAQCPAKPHVMPFAHETLQYLKNNYRLNIITNGFNDVQYQKLESAGLHEFFEHVFTADSCGYQKPHKEIFEYALDKAGTAPENSIMIGDNLNTDIEGARNAGIDQVFYNPYKILHHQSVTYEIACLSDIRHIL